MSTLHEIKSRGGTAAEMALIDAVERAVRDEVSDTMQLLEQDIYSFALDFSQEASKEVATQVECLSKILKENIEADRSPSSEYTPNAAALWDACRKRISNKVRDHINPQDPKGAPSKVQQIMCNLSTAQFSEECPFRLVDRMEVETSLDKLRGIKGYAVFSADAVLALIEQHELRAEKFSR